MTDMFEWNGLSLDYERGGYNAAGTNERAVEVPIARRWITGRGVGIEVGNVLSHYGEVDWPVFDRYEGPMRVDVFDVAVAAPLDWIVTVSTLEHVRWDEDPDSDRDPTAFAGALTHLRGLLAPTGRLLLTMPFGCRGDLDDKAASGGFGERYSWVLHRDALDGPWMTTLLLVRPSRAIDADWYRSYGPLGANAVWIAEFGPNNQGETQ